jgi:hypothetical protein
MVYVSRDTLESMGEKEANRDNVEELINMGRGRGIVETSGSISLVQQVPWIQNKTI